MAAYPEKRTWPHVLMVAILFLAFLKFPQGAHPPRMSPALLARFTVSGWKSFVASIESLAAKRHVPTHSRVNPRTIVSTLVVPNLNNLPLPNRPPIDAMSTWKRQLWHTAPTLRIRPLHPPVAQLPASVAEIADATEYLDTALVAHQADRNSTTEPTAEVREPAASSSVALENTTSADQQPATATATATRADGQPDKPDARIRELEVAETDRTIEADISTLPSTLEESLGLDLAPTDRANLADWLPEPVAPKAGEHDLVLNQAWPYPSALHGLLGQLQPESQQVASWKAQVKDQLETLQAMRQLEGDASKAALRQLQSLAADTKGLEAYLTEANRVTLRRLRYAIERRVSIWWHARSLAADQAATPHLLEPVESYGLLQTVEKKLDTHQFAEAWRKYLLLDRLMEIATQTWVTDSTVRRRVAREVLSRMNADDLSDEQIQFLTAPVFGELKTELVKWADGDVDLVKLVNAIEQFEDVRSATLAEALVRQMESIQYSRRPGARPLHDALSMHYRNANVRLSVTGQLMNDLLPVLKPIQQQVRDNILGAEVIGRNQTRANLNLQLIPDSGRLRMRLTAKGVSRTRTVAKRGPIRFLSRDDSNFVAGKELVVGTNGALVTRASAASNNRSTLLDVESDYDDIPLLGWVIRRMAVDGHDEQKPRLRAHVNRRVQSRATRQLDQSVHRRLTGAEQRVDEVVLAPLRKMKIDPHTVEMKTTRERMTVRFRLASQRQLAAYTPRPRALRDSSMSLQVHESTANNVLQQLDLEDQRVKLETLLQDLAESLGIDRSDIQDELPENVEVRLGNERPIQFEFDNDRVLVSVHLQELKIPRRKTYRNFVVRARYRAAIDQTQVNLERDGGIELISERIGFRDQITLRGIFTKVMTKNHRLNILHGQIKDNAQLNQLAITQFVVRDGWIGISIGKQRRDRVAASK